ncbi:MAG: signal recognition particle subunit SRP19/SEC65 family protein [Saccharolobus sp.]|uniref:Signal recognition particle 19 kDa protein n=2 Tax=Saccharolobus shibatae TaxID=2286 RepID=A0A8F5BYB0_9CREN|nr:signal recognition particle subunit SRP19/SEC65 family protein [Saccharolobus shibatae]MCH4814352.1 signal recognition particle protein Srp19 [Saccharolobus shibatae]QXJ27240.1 Signal recognition particle protein SRP19 [Saccharolobus shibatae B12]QXJ30517.1 Signal recognition particle protein SRP19 [Saccharolobus shibatae]QXJ33563.1 Signal recognition particle protein SRP19 [Saccharolobus shibatae]
MSLRDLKEENRIVIWPSYFFSPTRSKGRRLAKIPYKIKTEELVSTLKQLGLDPVIIENKKYPRDRKINFLIAVKKIKSKNYTLKIIYDALTRTRQASSNKEN